MESKKNEFEPTEIAEHLKGNVEVDTDVGLEAALREALSCEVVLSSGAAYRETAVVAVAASEVVKRIHQMQMLRRDGSAGNGQPARQPRLKTLIVWNDWLPSPGLRKQTAKMLADQQAHITKLQAEGRHTAARWHVCCSYGLWAWYIAARPVSMLVKTLTGKFGGT